MKDIPLTAFPPHAASRSFFLGRICYHVHKFRVWGLLAAEGFNPKSFSLYWQTRRPHKGQRHWGYCWVKFRTREMALMAWKRLDGMSKWSKTLIVRPLVRGHIFEWLAFVALDDV